MGDADTTSVTPLMSAALVLPEGMAAEIERRVDAYAAELSAVRRDLHAHPELSWAEVRTTRVLRERLQHAGLQVRTLPAGTGLICDVGQGRTAVALRADLDALPIQDAKDVPYRSTVPGICHACGHDLHTTVLLGAGLVLADLAAAGRLAGRVRLIFQPAEEVMPGGALDVLAAGELEGVRSIYALHCDPRTPVGQVGIRSGPITAASDVLRVHLRGPGGHTARPHTTADLVFALGKVVTELPAALSRRVDPRAGLSLVWGRISAGVAGNTIPEAGDCLGTVRCLDAEAWQEAPELITGLVHAIVEPYGVVAEIRYERGVPPVVNDADAAGLLAAAGRAALGADAVVSTEQSMGGEDFAWFLDRVPGALARLGTTAAGEEGGDLHRPTFDADERALTVGVRLFVAAALLSVQ